MLRNYLKIAFRSLRRHLGYTVINILGLALGAASVMLILLYVGQEMSYDKFHQHSDRLYRLNIEVTNPQTGALNKRAVGPYRLAKELKVDFPEWNLVRFAPNRELIEIGEEAYNEDRVAFVDPEVFEVFSFKLSSGNPQTALDDPFSVVITETLAEKYFDKKDPIGKVVRIRDTDFEVSGIMVEPEQNTQFEFDVLVSMGSGEQLFSTIVLENWGEGSVETFAMIPEGRSPADFEERLSDFVDEKLQSWKESSPYLAMQPLQDIYLKSQDIASFSSGGDITYVRAFGFIALFILLIACINFMNLSTARSSLRAKEVGLRKTVGAQRNQLIFQFLSESTLLAFISIVVGILICIAVLPFFSDLAESDFRIAALFRPKNILAMLGITALVGLAAGAYPAFVLSQVRPVQVISGKIISVVKGVSLRRVLVTLQFAISIFLLVVTIVVFRQLEYCQNIDLGYDKEQVLIFGTPLTLRERYGEFRSELLSDPQILNSAGSSRVPPGNLSSSLQTRPEGVPEDQQQGMQTVWTDFDFIETMGFELEAGRSFSRDFPADANEGFVLNEAAVKSIGWTNEEAIGKTFGSMEIRDWDDGQWEPRDGKVIGVLKNFHFESLKNEIVPTVYFVAPYMAWNYVVRIRPERMSETIAHIENTWAKFNPDAPTLEYSFVDERFATLYEADERQGRIFGIFAFMAICIACLGLIGLASFSAERKKKEIGIRKVLGATAFQLATFLTREFTVLVMLAFVVAAPLAWLVMRTWLEDFVYHIPLSVFIFIAAGVAALLAAWLTTGYQTLNAISRNPIDAIRSD